MPVAATDTQTPMLDAPSLVGAPDAPAPEEVESFIALIASILKRIAKEQQHGAEGIQQRTA